MARAEPVKGGDIKTLSAVLSLFYQLVHLPLVSTYSFTTEHNAVGRELLQRRGTACYTTRHCMPSSADSSNTEESATINSKIPTPGLYTLPGSDCKYCSLSSMYFRDTPISAAHKCLACSACCMAIVVSPFNLFMSLRAI